jgi:hypothetical protein
MKKRISSKQRKLAEQRKINDALIFTLHQSLKINQELSEHQRFVEHLFFVLRGEKDRSALLFDDPLMVCIIEMLREKGLHS